MVFRTWYNVKILAFWNNNKTIRIDCISFRDFRQYMFNRFFQLKGRFTRSNFDQINTENFCVHDGNWWCSHVPVFSPSYFVKRSKNFDNSCFKNFMPTSLQPDPAVTAILLNHLARPTVGRLWIVGSFDLIGWKWGTFYFHPIHTKCFKLVKLSSEKVG